jgi:acetolactate synthase II small subunit
MNTQLAQHNLRITAYDRPTVLEKLLQVTRYRGFRAVRYCYFDTKPACYRAIDPSVK